MEWARTRPDILLMWQDECWFSRFAQPNAHNWGGIDLLHRTPKPKAEQKALACYGAVRDDTRQMHLAFCPGQPNSEHTLAYLPLLLNVARAEHKKILIVIWDHASWHKSKKVRGWIQAHNRQAKHKGDVRLIVWLLPKKSPWLNPIEPRWIHGKRAVLEPGMTDLTPIVLRKRLCAFYHTDAFFLEANHQC